MCLRYAYFSYRSSLSSYENPFEKTRPDLAVRILANIKGLHRCKRFDRAGRLQLFLRQIPAPAARSSHSQKRQQIWNEVQKDGANGHCWFFSGTGFMAACELRSNSLFPPLKANDLRIILKMRRDIRVNASNRQSDSRGQPMIVFTRLRG